MFNVSTFGLDLLVRKMQPLKLLLFSLQCILYHLFHGFIVDDVSPGCLQRGQEHLFMGASPPVGRHF